MYYLLRFKEFLTRLEALVAALSLAALLLMVLVAVVARNFFDTGFPSMEMVMRYLVLFVGMMGAVLATDRTCHIKCDAVLAFISAKTRERIIRPLFVLTALVCVVLCWHAARFWWDEWLYAGAHDRWAIPLALVLPIGFGLLAVHFIILAFTGSPVRCGMEPKTNLTMRDDR